MKLASISSSSRGNCIFVGNKNTSVLVDAGISKKKIEEGLELLGKTPESLDGIVVTHEHSDHIRGLGVFLRKYPTPVYATEKTIEYMFENDLLGTVDTDLFYVVKPENKFSIKDIDIRPLKISHDAVDPVCYRLMSDNKSCAVVTDLGEYDERLIGQLQNLNAILAESNHDLGMLQTGPYPYHLKQRIWGAKGHLSNESCGRFLNEILGDNLSHIILGHLSGDNNYPELAFEAVRNEINFADHDFYADDFNIKVASRIEPSCLVEF